MRWRARLGVPERSVGRTSRARQDCLRSGWAIVEGNVWSEGVVVPSRPRFGCRRGTFSPSHRQIRATCLAFTCQPSTRNSAVIRR
jgi:hypothetical protein